MYKSFPLLVFVLLFHQYSFAQVAESAAEIKPLKIGEIISNVNVISLDEKQVSIRDIVSKKNTVLLFYRGGWCPYCNTHLAAIAETEETIRSLGYQIVGVSPDSAVELKKSINKNSLNYSLYSDSSTELMQAFGLAIEAPERYTNKLLQYSDNQNSHVIPVPAVYIINTNGEILYTYINPNYKERIEEEELLNVLKNLN